MSRACDKYCGECYSNVRGRSNYKGHVGYRVAKRPTWEDWRVFIKRASGTGGAGGAEAVILDPRIQEGYPALFEFLTATAWDEKTKRKPGTALLFAEEGRWKLCLVDKDAGRVAFLAADTLADLAAVAEDKLVEDTVEWRRQKPWAGRK